MMILRKEIEEKSALLNAMESKYFDIRGEWKFTTEEDCEGSSSKVLGTYKGSLFNGIKVYGDRAYYSLRCERVRYLDEKDDKPKKRAVNFSVVDKSIMLFDEQDQVKKLLPYLPEGHVLKEGDYYGCVALEWEE